ncbi:MAG: hypothetical protein LBR79_05545 [Oscillospiraceae bacterium]|jgi:hypothetical protein|nr:hypothetical protein [Oscillospiraceae bacterium]
MEIKFLAPKIIVIELNNVAKGIQVATKGRESRSLHNTITSNKNLNIEFTKKLNPLNNQLSELGYEYNIDPQFKVFWDQVITSLFAILKKHRITLDTPKTNKKDPDYVWIQENLNETEKIIASVQRQIKEIQSLTAANLDKIAVTARRYKTEASTSQQDFKKKNDVVTKYMKTLKTVKDENHPCVLSDEKKFVAKLKKSLEKWHAIYPDVSKNAEDFLARANAFDTSKITSVVDKKISSFKKPIEQKLSKFTIEISECAKSCNGEVEFGEALKRSDKIVKEARLFLINFGCEIKKLGECVSEAINKENNTLREIKMNFVDAINDLIALYILIASLTEDLWSLLHNLEIRELLEGMYVYDKTEKDMNMKSPLNTDRLKNPGKNLQSCHAIAHGKENIKQAWYYMNYPTWILVDETGQEGEVQGIATPYKDYKPFQEAIRRVYRGLL